MVIWQVCETINHQQKKEQKPATNILHHVIEHMYIHVYSICALCAHCAHALAGQLKFSLLRAGKVQDYEVIMIWAVCCMVFFFFFRLGEILLPSGCTYDSNIHLSVGDVAVDNVEDPKMVQISLKHSKTDQFGQGSKTYLGRIKNDLCPVAAILTYLALRGKIQGHFSYFRMGRLQLRTTL